MGALRRLIDRRRLRSLIAVGAAAAVVGTVAVVGGASPAHPLELFQTGHWIYNVAESVVYHISGGSTQVDAKTQPFAKTLGASQVVQGDMHGYVVSDQAITSFGKSTLVVDSTAAAPGTEQPLALETAGGPYLVYRTKGTVVRLGASLADPIDVGGPVEQAIADDEGDVWLERSDRPLVCLLERGDDSVSCDVATPRGHLGSLTVVDGKAAFVDTTAGTIAAARPGRLGTPARLGAQLQPNALVAAQGPAGSVAAINPDAGTLVIASVPAREGRPPVVVPLGTGPFSAPLGSEDAVVVLDQGRGEVLTIGVDGRELDRAQAPSGGDSRMTRGQDGRVYVDAEDGSQSLVADRDGRLITVDAATVEVASAPPQPQPQPSPPSPAPAPPAQDEPIPPSQNGQAGPGANQPPAGVPAPVPVPVPGPEPPPQTEEPPEAPPPAPESPPATPLITGTAPLGSEVRVDFDLPADGKVTSITVDATGDAPTSVTLSSPQDRTAVLPLPCGDTITVTVTAEGPGGSTTSDPVGGVVSCVPPGQPSITGTNGGNGWITVSFDAPASNGATYDIAVDGSTVRTGQTPGTTTGRIAVTNGSHQVVVTATSPDGATSTSAPATATAQQVQVYAYDNWGGGASGMPMCRGNPGAPTSMPGGQVSQTMTVPQGVGSITTVLIQIDPAPEVTAQLRVLVNGAQRAAASALASGDTTFGIGTVPVAAGDTVTLLLNFTSTGGTIITVYAVGAPGGTLTVSNSCSASTFNTTTGAGLRARVSGWND